MSEIIILKKCTTCGEGKTHGNFRRQSKNKDGLKYTCKICDNNKAKDRYKNKKDTIVLKVKEWQLLNPEKVKMYKKKYRNKHIRRS